MRCSRKASYDNGPKQVATEFQFVSQDKEGKPLQPEIQSASANVVCIGNSESTEFALGDIVLMPVSKSK